MKYATTDKLNDSMKAKVFKYRSDGNTVVGCTSTQARTCLTTSYRNRTVSDWGVLRYAQPKTVKAPNWALTVPGSF